MRIPLFVALFLAAMSPVLQAQDAGFPVALRVLDETGTAVPDAVVTVGRHQANVDTDGAATLLLSRAHPLTLRIDAEGYYSTVQTVTPGGAVVPDIHLVKKRAGRRLLLFAGDAMLSRRYMKPRAGERILVRDDQLMQDGQRLLQFVKPYVELADLASVNVETVLADKAPGEPLPKSVTFFSPPALAELLRWAGFDYAALGNNHVYDFRDRGLKSTLRALDDAGLGYSGAGLDEAAARAPYLTAVDGSDIAMLSYVGWPGTFRPTQSAAGDKGGAALGNGGVFEQDIAAAADSGIVILQQHAGIEYAEQPALTERSDFRLAVDAGADVVIGHHPHVLQGIEIRGERLIAYSMGNFLFDQYIYSTQGGMLLYVWLDGEKVHRAEVVPLNINGYVPTPATGAFRHWVLNRIARLSAPFGTCFEASGQHAVVRRGPDCEPPQQAAVQVGSRPQSTFGLGLDPLRMLVPESTDSRYRVGVDLLPRGDFEASGLFGTPPRAWQTGKQAAIEAGDKGQRLAVTVPNGKRVRTGMKVFDRAFQVSMPATASGRVFSDQPVVLRAYLQRRRSDDALAYALSDGPMTRLGETTVEPGAWQEFRFEHAMPRLATKAVRLLIELRSAKGAVADANVLLDDLSWIEWRTPWMSAGEQPAFGTHIEVRQ